VVYWYSYAMGLPTEGDHGQIWLIGQPEDKTKPEYITFYRPKGKWMGEKYELGAPVAYGTLTADSDTLTLEYRLVNLGPCKPVNVSPVWGGCSGKWILQRLTRRAG